MRGLRLGLGLHKSSGLPQLPSGYAFLIKNDGSYLTKKNGCFLTKRIT